MRFGFFGKVLSIDLETRESDVLAISPDDVRQYFLGSGWAAKYLYDSGEVFEPLDPRNPLLFIAGLFTGGNLPGTSKVNVCARSPLTGIWNEATVGGHWGAEFRKTGFDGLIFRGRSAEPVFLMVTPEGATFHDAADLWGKDTFETNEMILSRVGKKANVATIGPGGENLVRYASVMFDPPHYRAAARSGVGAVMGSKNLKAVVVRGDRTTRVPIADPDGLKAQIKLDGAEVRGKTKGLRDWGTSGGVETVEVFGDLPIKNWQLGAWKEGARKISGFTIQPQMLHKHYSCFACPVRCGKIYNIPTRDEVGHGPEFESLGMLGSNCLVDDGPAIVAANDWCNRYGIDSISTGSCVAFAIEAFERGVVTTADTDGVALAWDAKTLLHLVHQIGKREGVGELLGEGVKLAAERLGNGADAFAVHTKGLEYPAHDPRGHVSMALNYATAARGACHLEALSFFLDRGTKLPDLGYLTPPDAHDSSDKAPIVVNMQNYMSVFNPLGMCKFMFVGGVGPKKIANWVNLWCGTDMDMDEVLTVGERIFNLKRMYNCRLGISRKNDVLPHRLGTEAKPDGTAKGVLPDLEPMLNEFYALRGWSDDGVPTEGKLRELGI